MYLNEHIFVLYKKCFDLLRKIQKLLLSTVGLKGKNDKPLLPLQKFLILTFKTVDDNHLQ